MLDEILSEIRRRVVFRLSRVSSDDERFLADFNLDADGRDELLNLLSGQISQSPIDELLDGPFRARSKLRNDAFLDPEWCAGGKDCGGRVAFWFGKEYVEHRRAVDGFIRDSVACYGVEKDLRSSVVARSGPR